MPLVYAFDHDHAAAPRELAALLGGKGANLAEMTSVLGLPVPPGFTVTTEACVEVLARRAGGRPGWPDGLLGEIAEHLGLVEARTGRRLGDPRDPLLLSVRSGARYSMPGMMDTVLNLGLSERTVEGLARHGGERFARRAFARLLAMYARVVRRLDAPPLEDDPETDADEWSRRCRTYLDLLADSEGGPFPDDPRQQLVEAIDAVFASWNGERAVAYRRREGIPDDLGTAVNVQAMVFGNLDRRSGTGVAFSRDAATGENRPYGDVLLDAQGEDVVAGVRATEPLERLRTALPDLHDQLLGHLRTLEVHYRDLVDVEFTIESGVLWLLQVRLGKRTGVAAVRIAVELVDDDAIRLTHTEAVQRVTAEHLEQVLHPRLDAEGLPILTRGLPASPGAAVGSVVLRAEDAVARAAQGERVILVRRETDPEDVSGMLAAAGVLTARGGLVSHAAVVARGWGTPAVVGAHELEVRDDGFQVGSTFVAAGDTVSIDGSTGAVVLGAAAVLAAAPPPQLDVLLSWADELRGDRLEVRANADDAADARVALRLGAQGIGLCRTEHMFLRPDRLPIVRRALLADDDTQRAALEELRRAQRDDFRALLEVMDARPVTVRLLDPPLHEFLPDLLELERRDLLGGLDREELEQLAAARRWSERNPMLGVRGVRLGVLRPELYRSQVRALLEAVRDRLDAGGDPRVEVMIPLTVCAEELATARGWVDEVARELGVRGRLAVGTMIETPRAALVADRMAAVADFFSFGTNDLTQMTFGFSRDDLAAELVPAYLDRGLLDADPFSTIDPDGVGALLRTAVERGRSVRPELPLGVCGEHGGDPASIRFLVGLGVDHVSCSPYRVPIARLAGAHALVGTSGDTR